MKRYSSTTYKERRIEEESDLPLLLEKLHILMLERWELYQKHMEFSSSGSPSNQTMNSLKEKTSYINRIHNLVNKRRLERGDDPEQVKMEDVRRIMNVNENARCAVLFKS